MAFPKKRHFRKKRVERPDRRAAAHELMQPQQTGSEAAYLKSLVDSRAKVTVVLRDGERLSGRIRYYDHDCFSIGLSAKGPRIFLRKDSVSYISEDQRP
jgi:host factor-I protein